MRIGIDIDDTVTDTRKVFSHQIKKYRHAHKIKRYSEEKQLDEEKFQEFLKEKGAQTYKKVKPKKDAIKIIQKWIENGHEIYFITARGENDAKDIEEMTKEFFERYKIEYEKIVFHSQNKAEDAQNLGLDVFIDDRESVLDTFKNTGVYRIRFLENKKNYSKYQKASNWKELDQIITKL